MVQGFRVAANLFRRVMNLRGYRPQYRISASRHITIEPGDYDSIREPGSSRVVEYVFDEFHYTEQTRDGDLRTGFEQIARDGSLERTWSNAAVRGLDDDDYDEFDDRAWAAADDFRDDIGY